MAESICNRLAVVRTTIDNMDEYVPSIDCAIKATKQISQVALLEARFMEIDPFKD